MGEIVGGAGFGASVSCNWLVEAGDQWRVLGGAECGQTQVDCAAPGFAEDMVVWAHPLDLHYKTNSLQVRTGAPIRTPALACGWGC